MVLVATSLVSGIQWHILWHSQFQFRSQFQCLSPCPFQSQCHSRFRYHIQLESHLSTVGKADSEAVDLVDLVDMDMADMADTVDMKAIPHIVVDHTAASEVVLEEVLEAAS
ncbi:hypothetical protein AWZ03_004046 [Drosophila navojoa]|uniref:Uncharacterized protein n=1 Tax=Drosophila navojoa TaxID=7232 RepID=A0A484BNV8_DRONA|nr:hypothetical protein AWZ03_004046 [Drosophila navojoa]